MISFYRLHPKTGRNSNRKDRIRKEIKKRRAVEMKKIMEEKEKWERLSDFEKLPAEVLNEIISFVPESIGMLRGISSTMTQSVGRFRALREYKPYIPHLTIKQDQKLPRLSVSILLDSNTTQYFEFPRAQLMNRNLITYSRIAEKDAKFLEEIKKSLSLRVEKLHIERSGKLNMDIPERLLDGMIFKAIYMSLPEHFDSARLLNFLAKTRADKVNFWFGKISIANPVELLLGLAEICTEIQLWQYGVESIPNESDYFFGRTNGDWGRVFTEMFKRKMDSLYITNSKYCAFLPGSTCHEFAENLSKVTGKELRFASSYLPVEIVAGETNRTVLDYTITENIVINIYPQLSSNRFYITHQNRPRLNFF